VALPNAHLLTLAQAVLLTEVEAAGGRRVTVRPVRDAAGVDVCDVPCDFHEAVGAAGFRRQSR
jgi:hypothetical protein